MPKAGLAVGGGGDVGPGWQSMIRAERLRAELTQRQLADNSGMSLETIRKYESAVRTPNRERLKALLRAMSVPQSRTSAILHAAGFAADEQAPRGSGYYQGEAEARAEIEHVPWPAFLVNEVLDVLAANAAARAIWAREASARRSFGQESLVKILADPVVWSHLRDPEASLLGFIGELKSCARSAGDETRVEALLAECLALNPTSTRRLLRAWEVAPATNPRAHRSYELEWREDDVRIRFLGVAAVCNEPDGLTYHDWYPADAVSHLNLEALLARRAGRTSAGGRWSPWFPK